MHMEGTAPTELERRVAHDPKKRGEVGASSFHERDARRFDRSCEGAVSFATEEESPMVAMCLRPLPRAVIEPCGDAGSRH